MAAPLRCALAAFTACASLAGLAGCQAGAPAFSPDGRRVAVAADGLRIVDLRTGVSRPVAPEASAPLWSPDGRHVLYEVPDSDVEEGKAAVYEVAAAKTHRLPGTGGPPFAWSPDSTRLVSFADGPGGTEAIWYELAAGGVVSRATIPREPGGLAAVWLPGTHDVAYVSNGDMGGDVYRVGDAGVRRLTRWNDVVGLNLSADGRRLLLARTGGKARPGAMSVYTYDLAHGALVRTPFPEGRLAGIRAGAYGVPAIGYVVFAPTGDRLALLAMAQRGDPDDPSGTDMRCYVANIDGTGARLVRSITSPKDPKGFLIPSWSADGRRLAMMVYQEKKGSLEICRPDGAGLRVAYRYQQPASPP